MASTTSMPVMTTTSRPKPVVIDKQNPSLPPSFWKDLDKIRTNSFAFCDENVSNGNSGKKRNWTFRSRKSHILDTEGHYQWQRELNCFHGQHLPEAVFPHNTLEILIHSSPRDVTDTGANNYLRIRFGALEGLRGWMSLDAPPIPTSHARDNAHWKAVAANDRLPKKILLGSVDETIASVSYDYAYTTPYRGGTDSVVENNTVPTDGMETGDYGYLRPDSSSFVRMKHDAVSASHDLSPAKMTRKGKGPGIERVKLRKPICKCKGVGGRKPIVSSSTQDELMQDSNGGSTTEELSNGNQSTLQNQYSSPPPPPPPVWKPAPNYRVDIEGMLRRARQPFLFREDVDLWEDDLHDNGIAWLKARCFVCPEGWACLLRNFVRVDGVLCRVVDTRYIHAFGSSRIYREHSWREGSWEKLLRAMPPHRSTLPPGMATTAAVRPRPSAQAPPPMVQPSINDSIAARLLPLVRAPVTEYLSLEPEPQPKEFTEDGQQRQNQLVMIHDASIEDGTPVPNAGVEKALGISFVLKRSKGKVLQTISSTAIVGGGNGNSDNATTCLWSKAYSSTKAPQATILTIGISPDPTDCGRLAIGDDCGWVQVWKLTTGEFLFDFPVAPLAIRNRLAKNPLFQSERLWVDHLAWSADGSLLGASAGRTAVLASTACSGKDEENSCKEDRILSTLGSASGTVTGLAFRNRSPGKAALAVASYGEVRWLADSSSLKPDTSSKTTSDNKSDDPTPLKRDGAAIECIDISPNGKTVAVGFLDKTLRIFTMGVKSSKIPTTASSKNGAAAAATTITHMPSASSSSKTDAVVDWVGFSAAVKSVRFSPGGKFLAAMGGSAILVIPDSLDSRNEAPIICRTPGQTKGDGGDGTCHKFLGSLRWSTSGDQDSKLAALDADTGEVHVFCFTNHGYGKAVAENHQDAWPIRALPVRTVSPFVSNPTPFATTRFAFFCTDAASTTSDNQEDGQTLAFRVLDRSFTTPEKSQLHERLESKLRVDDQEASPYLSKSAEKRSEGDNEATDDNFSFRIIV